MSVARLSTADLCDNSPAHLASLAKVALLDQALIFTGLPWYTGLVAPCATLALPAGGRILAFDRPSMFLFFSCAFGQERGR